jgi:hypothetical protein
LEREVGLTPVSELIWFVPEATFVPNAFVLAATWLVPLKLFVAESTLFMLLFWPLAPELFCPRPPDVDWPAALESVCAVALSVSNVNSPPQRATVRLNVEIARLPRMIFFFIFLFLLFITRLYGIFNP